MELAIGFLAAALMAHFVYRDAHARAAARPMLWAIGTFLLAIVFLPAWLITRPPLEATPTGPRRCTYCAGAVQPTATVCMHCGEDLPLQS